MRRAKFANALLYPSLLSTVVCMVWRTSASAQSTTNPAGPVSGLVVALSLPPSTTCTVTPETGDAQSASRIGYLTAGNDGEARFYPPPPTWGTKLTVNCALNGVKQGSYVVDLNDSSTFKRESQSSLQAQSSGVLPALTGDLQALSLSQLLQRGYPPRPDATIDPKGYAAWVQRVTIPNTIYHSSMIANFAETFDQFEGQYSCNENPGGLLTGGWTAMVQSADGFDPSSLNCQVNGKTLSGDTYYWLYAADTVYPDVSQCRIQNGFGCDTGIWAGIGGFGVDGINGSLDLIQSGFAMEGVGNVQFFIKFTSPGSTLNPPLPTGDQLTPGDVIEIWGWAADGDCEPTLGLAPTEACFGIKNITKNWTFAPTTEMPSPSVPNQTTLTYLPATAEFAVEVGLNYTNAEYLINPGSINEAMEGAFWDQTGMEHVDPGGGGKDEFIFTQQNDPQGMPFNQVTWDNGTGLLDDPVDPVVFNCTNLQ